MPNEEPAAASITIPVVKGSWALGCNGAGKVCDVMLRLIKKPKKPDKASISFLAQRSSRSPKVIMNAGGVIDADGMDQLAKQWLELRKKAER